MTLLTISVLAATVIYAAYNAIAIKLFGIPKSLSITFYHYQDRYNKGFLFPMMMFFVVTLMMPAWIQMSEGSTYQFLAFLAPAAIMFVGTAPAFLSSNVENKVHMVSAILAALCSILWIVLVTKYWWIILIWLVIVGVLAYLSKSYKTAYIYWLENIAFLSTFTSCIIYSCEVC